jgi:hypothetical protein
MKKSGFVFSVLFLVLLISCPMLAGAQDTLTTPDEPALEIFTNKKSYHAGDSGFAVLRLDTYGKLDSAEIQIEILSPGGKLVEGDILYTKIPKGTIVNPDTKQTVQVLYDESIYYFGPEKTIYRTVDFEVPMDIPTGDYIISGQVTGAGVVLHEKTGVHISGPGGFLNYIFLLYIVVLLYSLYLLRRS